MAEDPTGSGLGGSTGASASGGASAPAPVGGSSGGGAQAGATGQGAGGGTGTVSGTSPNGGASGLVGLYVGAFPVHPHLDDPTGGYLSAYAAVDHTHPSSTSAVYTFSTQTGMTDPGSGHLRANTGVLSTATTLDISTTTTGGTQGPPVSGVLQAGDRLYVQDRDDNTRWTRYDVAGAATPGGTYNLLPVTVTASSGVAIANNQNVELVVTLAGSSGSGGGTGGGATLPHTHTDDTSGAVVDYVRLVVSATAPASPASPSDALWLNPTEAA
jgi:hypothetical protein